MANKIQIKRGNKANLPNLSDGELAYCKDTNQLYVGNSGTNKEIGGSNSGGLVNSGTWIPTAEMAHIYNSRVGTYTKIGNVVTAYFSIDVTYDHCISGLVIGGLPFKVAHDSAAPLASVTSGYIKSDGIPMAVAVKGKQQIEIRKVEISSSAVTLRTVYGQGDFPRDGRIQLSATITYLSE